MGGKDNGPPVQDCGSVRHWSSAFGSPDPHRRGPDQLGPLQARHTQCVMEQHDSSIRASSVGRLPSWVVTGYQFPTLARVTYRGDSRPVDSIRAEVVRRWGLSFLRDSSMAKAFHREYLFQEGQRSLWLPVQDTVASYFTRELKPGQDVTLYVLWLGAYYAGHDITWAFIVTEFKADATQR